jgi:predicted enzyme related to lactoylglutathione lyase
VKLRFPTWIGVVCDDFERQRAFYREVLGLRETEAGEDWAEYDMGAGVTFELIRRSQDPEYDGRRYQVGFAVDDISAAREELLARGVEAVTDVVEGTDGSPWAYFRDPEGNVFEIKQR